MLSVDEEETELIKRTLGITIENNQYFNIAKSEKSIFPPFDWRKEEKDIPRIVFLPTEINFSNLEVKTRNYKPEENFSFTIDQNKINDVPSYLVSLVNTEIFKYEVADGVSEYHLMIHANQNFDPSINF
mgnify:CR=1 FL=1